MLRESSHGKARRHRLGDADYVGLDAEVLEGEQLAGASHAALNLVEDERGVVLIGSFAAGLKKLGRRNLDAAFTLDRLEHDAANRLVHRGAQSLDVVARNKAHALQHGLEAMRYFDWPVSASAPMVRP